jgi:hypothetical protein
VALHHAQRVVRLVPLLILQQGLGAARSAEPQVGEQGPCKSV